MTTGLLSRLRRSVPKVCYLSGGSDLFYLLGSIRQPGINAFASYGDESEINPASR
jgi:hypothetical protein